MAFDHEMQRRFDRVADAVIEALNDDPALGRVRPSVPIDGFDGGQVNARGAAGKIIRAALKERLVYADERQAEFIALSGSAGHDDTATDLRPDA